MNQWTSGQDFDRLQVVEAGSKNVEFAVQRMGEDLRILDEEEVR